MQKHRFYYWFDERCDDFANNGINGKPTPEDFEYFPKNILYRVFKPVVYYLFMIVVALLVRPITGIWRVHNARVLHRGRDCRKGCFIYGNHTNAFADALFNPVFALPHQTYIVSNPDAISIPFCGTFLRMLGVAPVPHAHKTRVRYIEAIRKMFRRGNAVAIYPEAHIWPKYNGVRDFPDGSFHLPVELGAPCYVKSVVYRNDRRDHSHGEIWYDGPFYPRTDLPPKQAQKDLRDRVYNCLCERCRESEQDSRYHYVKVDSPEQVRTEIIAR